MHLAKLRSHTLLFLILLLILAAGLRFYQLNVNGLWVDEIFTALIASPDKTLAEVISAALDTPLPTPPLWFIISHGFMKVLGVSDTVVRLPAVIAGVLGVWAIYLVGKTLFDQRVGWSAAVLLALSPMHLYISREARYYAPITLFSLLTIYFLHQGLTHRQKKWWVGFTLATLCNIYIHLTAIFVLAGEAVYVGIWWAHRLYTRRSKNKLRHSASTLLASLPTPFIVSLFAIVLCYLPMAFVVPAGLSGERGLGSTEALEGFELSINYFLTLFSSFGPGPGWPFSLFLGSALLGVWQSWRRHTRPLLLFLLLTVTPFIIILILRPKHWFSYKYVAFILPVYLLTVALGLVHLVENMAQLVPKTRRKQWTQVMLAALVALYGLLSLAALEIGYRKQIGNWRGVGAILTHNLQPADAVVTLPTEILTLDVAEIMAYYGPTAEDADILRLTTVPELEAAQAAYRRMWVFVDQYTDLAAAGELVAWLDTQPHIALDLGYDTRIYYLGAEIERSHLLQEAGTFSHLKADSLASLAAVHLQSDQPDAACASYSQALHQVEAQPSFFTSALTRSLFPQYVDEMMADTQIKIHTWRAAMHALECPMIGE